MSDVSTKQSFNDRLTELNAEDIPSYSPFFENVLRAARDTATIIKRPTIGWFEENEALLQPPIKEKHLLRSKWRSATGNLKDDLLIKQRETSNIVKDKIALARAN